MKKICLLIITFVFLFISSQVEAQNVKSIQLTDGSSIQGKVVGMNNGVYTVETPVMGTIKLNESKVVSISQPGMTATPPNQMGATAGGPGMQQQVMQMQQQIFSNPALMQDIKALSQDPEIMQLLSDPSLMQAATNMNVKGVQTNPNTQKLMQNPKMQELMRKIAGQQGIQ